MDPKFITAQTAEARCRAGEFTLNGRTLVPLSALHFSVLEGLLGEDLFSNPEELDLADLEIISLVCSEEFPTGRLPVLTEEQREIAGLLLMQFKVAEERLAWAMYFDVCVGSRPDLKDIHGTAPESGVPTFFRCVGAILSGAQSLEGGGVRSGLTGFTFDRLWREMPLAAMLWVYELMREIRDGCTYIDVDKDAVPPTPEDEAVNALAGKVLGQYTRKLLQIGTEKKEGRMDAETYQAREKEFAAERERLMWLLREGRLAEDLTEKPQADGKWQMADGKGADGSPEGGAS